MSVTGTTLLSRTSGAGLPVPLRELGPVARRQACGHVSSACGF